MADQTEGPRGHVRVALLDGFRLSAGADEPALPLTVQRLVARLGLADRPQRGMIAGLLWPDVPEKRAHGSLRSSLWRLERCCPGLVQTSQGAVYLAPDVGVDVRDLVRWARRMLTPGAGPDDARAPDVAFVGDLLPGWYDDWVLVEREYLHQLRLHALEALTAKLASVGRYGEALEAAHGALRCEPLRESAHRLVIRIHLAEGNSVEALRHYERFAAALRKELGVAPTERLTQLVAALRPGPRRLVRS